MRPEALTSESFRQYPERARALALRHLELLRSVPLPFLPILLRELIVYDWKFPAERATLDAQLEWLGKLSRSQISELFRDFASLRLDPALESLDWVGNPAQYMERLTASLWSTQQMERFRAAAEAYAKEVETAAPTPLPAKPRLAIVIVGKNAAPAGSGSFRLLRPHGVYLDRLQPQGGLEALLQATEERAEATGGTDAAYTHWYIDGAAGEGPRSSQSKSKIVQISYDGLADARKILLSRARRAISSEGGGPEALRSSLAQLRPEEIGLGRPGSDPILERFRMTLLTEGSGTQIFATTFVQWAARECLRRAQPSTLVARFTPRQRQQGMNELLSGAQSTGPDPAGSLVDAEMGAYYTWINLLRLPGAQQARLLVWHEETSRALIAGPGLPRGTTASSSLTMKQLLEQIA